METISTQENQSVFSEFQCIKEKFAALEQENHCLLGDLQQIALEKKQHWELTLRVQQLDATIELQQQGSSTQGIHKEPKIGLPAKFDGTRSQFRGFLN